MLRSYLGDLVTIRYGTAAATALYAYDFLLTFGDEVTYVWNSPRTTTSFFFFIVRYLAFGYIITFTTLNILPLRTTVICKAIESFVITFVILFDAAEVILQMRLFALYNNDKRMVIPVLILFGMTVCAQLGMASYEVYYNNLDLTGVDALIAEAFGICPGGTPNWFYVCMIPITVFDFVLFVLVLFKSLQHYRQVPDRTWFGARVIQILMRDSLLFFIINFIMFLVCILVFLVGSHSLYQMIGNLGMVIIPILADRLVLNVRRFYSNPDSQLDRVSTASNNVIELQDIIA